MALGIKLGRAVETPFGRISDASLRAGVGKYLLQAILLLVFVMMAKGHYLVAFFCAAIAIAMFYQWPLSRFLSWRKPWFAPYFYGHLGMSILVGLLLPSQQYPGWVFLWGLANLVFGYGLLASLAGDIEDLLQGRIDFSNVEKNQ